MAEVSTKPVTKSEVQEIAKECGFTFNYIGSDKTFFLKRDKPVDEGFKKLFKRYVGNSFTIKFEE